jgi:hypothetical protein
MLRFGWRRGFEGLFGFGGLWLERLGEWDGGRSSIVKTRAWSMIVI